MAVLVTGASGFLGSRLVERLAADGRDVVAVTRRREAPRRLASDSRVRWLQWDIAQDAAPPAMPCDIESVVHLAGATLGAGTD